MGNRISSLDSGYKTGDLSVYPEAIDTEDTLYTARNNAETFAKQTVSYNAKQIIVDDASAFPTTGLIRIGSKDLGASPELIYYGSRTNTLFSDLQRGFAGSIQNTWPSGPTTLVSNSVMAEHHNAIKDAIINIETHLGTIDFPSDDSINGKIKALEVKYLAPKPLFRAFPTQCPPGTPIRFQNFSGGNAIRFLWDFGDGTTLVETSPFHTYQQEGTYTVKLNVITSTGAQGISVKSNYITVGLEEKTPFFYSEPSVPTTPNYSIETATKLNSTPQTFDFVDQTDGNVVKRYWVFDDGSFQEVSDPDAHTTTHIYAKPGIYNPSLLVIFSNQKLKRVFLSNNLIVE